jgi:hypothetical protein
MMRSKKQYSRRRTSAQNGSGFFTKNIKINDLEDLEKEVIYEFIDFSLLVFSLLGNIYIRMIYANVNNDIVLLNHILGDKSRRDSFIENYISSRKTKLPRFNAYFEKNIININNKEYKFPDIIELILRSQFQLFRGSSVKNISEFIYEDLSKQGSRVNECRTLYSDITFDAINTYKTTPVYNEVNEKKYKNQYPDAKILADIIHNITTIYVYIDGFCNKQKSIKQSIKKSNSKQSDYIKPTSIDWENIDLPVPPPPPSDKKKSQTKKQSIQNTFSILSRQLSKKNTSTKLKSLNNIVTIPTSIAKSSKKLDIVSSRVQPSLPKRLSTITKKRISEKQQRKKTPPVIPPRNYKVQQQQPNIVQQMPVQTSTVLSSPERTNNTIKKTPTYDRLARDIEDINVEYKESPKNSEDIEYIIPPRTKQYDVKRGQNAPMVYNQLFEIPNVPYPYQPPSVYGNLPQEKRRTPTAELPFFRRIKRKISNKYQSLKNRLSKKNR